MGKEMLSRRFKNRKIDVNDPTKVKRYFRKRIDIIF